MAKDLAVSVYAVTRPAIKVDRGLCDQMRRAAVSIASNIAEGNERGSDRDACRFFYMAKGSSGELRTQLIIAADVGLLPAAQANPLFEDCTQIGRMLQGLIDYRSGKPSCPLPPAPCPSQW